MKQEDLLDWVKTHGCIVTHQIRGFYKVINSEGKEMGIPKPRDGYGDIQPLTICRICTMLNIRIPEYARVALVQYNELQKDRPGSERGG
jgi:hypothetical protein